MIKASELRVGNWIKAIDPRSHYNDNRKEFVIIQSIVDDENGLHLNTWRVEGFADESLREAEPIPLTPELLEKAGFKYDKHNDNYKTKDFYFVCTEFEKTFWKKSFGSCLMIADDVQTLHRLQNLYFALTGEELEINLP